MTRLFAVLNLTAGKDAGKIVEIDLKKAGGFDKFIFYPNDKVVNIIVAGKKSKATKSSMKDFWTA